MTFTVMDAKGSLQSLGLKRFVLSGHTLEIVIVFLIAMAILTIAIITTQQQLSEIVSFTASHQTPLGLRQIGISLKATDFAR
jgi:hypothetical protein